MAKQELSKYAGMELRARLELLNHQNKVLRELKDRIDADDVWWNDRTAAEALLKSKRKRADILATIGMDDTVQDLIERVDTISQQGKPDKRKELEYLRQPCLTSGIFDNNAEFDTWVLSKSAGRIATMIREGASTDDILDRIGKQRQAAIQKELAGSWKTLF